MERIEWDWKENLFYIIDDIFVISRKKKGFGWRISLKDFGFRRKLGRNKGEVVKDEIWGEVKKWVGDNFESGF